MLVVFWEAEEFGGLEDVGYVSVFLFMAGKEQ
jgi:hypothetical protein